MRTTILCLSAIAALAPAQAFLGSTPQLSHAASRNSAAAMCATTMSSQEGKLDRRAALLTAITTGAAFASKADAAGLNLMPPGLKSIKDGVDARKAGAEGAGEAAAAGSKFESAMPKMPQLKAPSFTVPNLGPTKKAEEAGGGDAEEAPKKPKKGRMTMPSLGKTKPKPSEDDGAAAASSSSPPTPSSAPAPTPKPRKLKQAGMSGKEDERFKNSEIDSLEQKLLKKKTSVDSQLEEFKKQGEGKDESIPTLNPFAKPQ